ncbi:ribosomal protein S15 [Acrasis kona]|uniref:Ribosomal protein S15 n=1 Tax=Acrasis kona TaxID=1008807 RepID=A0AAW2Z6X4_9EUKA
MHLFFILHLLNKMQVMGLGHGAQVEGTKVAVSMTMLEKTSTLQEFYGAHPKDFPTRIGFIVYEATLKLLPG